MVALAALGLPAQAQAQETGTIAGIVVDSDTREPVDGVFIAVDGRGDLNASTDAQGVYRIDNVPAGEYELIFFKSGYRNARLSGVEVIAGEVARASFPLPPTGTLAPGETGADPGTGTGEEVDGEIVVLEEYSVTQEEVEQVVVDIERRFGADRLMEVFSAEDFSRFAAGDVADAIRRITGVSVVEGQFAIIRGLEDRYSSTTLNGAPIPSPDPDRQSVQLDLFPSEIVSSLEVSKTFAPELPSNSAGGSIDILTSAYPVEGETMFKVGFGFGINNNAQDRFIEAREGRAVGDIQGDDDPAIDRDLSVAFGLSGRLWDRNVRLISSFSHDRDYQTGGGQRQSRNYQQPTLNATRLPAGGEFSHIVETPPSALGLVVRESGALYDITESEYDKLTSVFIGVGFDLDEDSNHSLDFSVFSTEATNNFVSHWQNGRYLGAEFGEDPGNFGQLLNDSELGGYVGRALHTDDGTVLDTDVLEDNASPFANIQQSATFTRERDLEFFQGRGQNFFSGNEQRLTTNWNVTHAKTSQSEFSRRFGYWFEPSISGFESSTNTYRAADTVNSGDGLLSETQTDVAESMNYGSLDLAYAIDTGRQTVLSLGTGISYQKSEREVDSGFLRGTVRTTQTADTPVELEDQYVEAVGGDTLFTSVTNEREIEATYLSLKVEGGEVFELLLGVRFESLLLGSNSSPFIPYNPDLTASQPYTLPDGRVVEGIDNFNFPSIPDAELPNLFPSPYTIFFRDSRFGPGDGTDNPELLEIDDLIPGGSEWTSVDQLLDVLDRELNEDFVLPSIGMTYSPIAGMRFRVGFSKTVAQPSFREQGYYVTQERGGTLILGNPYLVPSEVQSIDFRWEYSWGTRGNLVAVSFFKKTIDKPIEKIEVAEPIQNLGFRTFFNNPNQGKLEGLEFEIRHDLGFAFGSAGEYFTLGGNYTYIDASVRNHEPIRERFQPFLLPELNPRRIPSPLWEPTPVVEELPEHRRLFNQPEWIANANLTWEVESWGTRCTLAYFAISDVLDVAPSAFVGNASPAIFKDSYGQLDLIFRQEWNGWVLQFTARNLTDSERKEIYDPYLLAEEVVRSTVKVGTDYGVSLSWVY